MITRYYGGNLSLDKVSDLCCTTKNGTSAYHLIKAAKQIGFKATGYKCKLEELIKQKEFPIIIHSEIDGNLHYMVLYKIILKKQEIIIANPSSKIEKMSFYDFKKIFTGICIKLYPYKIIPYESKNTILKDIIKFTVQKYKIELIKFIILSLLLIIINLFCSFYLKYIIDIVSTHKMINILTIIFILFCFSHFTKTVINFVSSIILSYFKQKFEYLLTSEIYNFVLDLPYSYFYRNTKGELIHRFHEIVYLKDFLINILTFIFIDFLPFLLTLIFIIIIYNAYLYMFLIHNILFFIIIYLVFPRLSKALIQSKENDIQLHNFINESINSYKSVKGINIKENIKNKFSSLFYPYMKKNLKLEKLILIISNSINFLENIIQTILLYLISVDIINKGDGLGKLVIMSTLLFYYFAPYKNYINIKVIIDRGKLIIDKLSNMVQDEKESGFIEIKTDGSIFIKDLTFSYDSFKKVLENIYLKLEKGTNTIFVGKSGSGKSTILKILKKYYSIPSNVIKIDTYDLNNYKYSSIEKGIGYIGPNENLFTDTLYNNIVLWKEIDEKKLSKILDICEIDKITSKNSLGINMFIYEDGFNISEGEKQRIVLARLLVSNFNILLIDEALNAVDINSERKILKGIFNYFKKETIIYVSHRFDNIDLFDKLVKFDKGRKVLDAVRNEDGKYKQESIFH